MQHVVSLGKSDKTTMIPISRSEVDALRKDERLQLMQQLGKVQPSRAVLVIEMKAMIKDLLFSKEKLLA